MNHIKTITQEVECQEKSEPKSMPYIAGFLLGSGVMKFAYSHDTRTSLVGCTKIAAGYAYIEVTKEQNLRQ